MTERFERFTGVGVRKRRVNAWVLSFLITGVGSLSATASSSSAPTDVTVKAVATFSSQYVFRGDRLAGPSVQPYVEANAGQTTFGLWTNFPLKDKVALVSNPEVDLYGSYNFDFTRGFSLTPGFTLYGYPDAPTNAGYRRSTFEPSLALNYTIPGVRLTPKIYYDAVQRGSTFELNGSTAFPLAHLGTELDFAGTIGTYKLRSITNRPTPHAKAWGDYWLARVSIPFQVSTHMQITVGWTYTGGINAEIKAGTLPKHSDPLAASRGIADIACAYTF